MASNYGLPATGVLTIGKATITVVGAADIDKTYDSTTALPNGATGFTYTGVYAGNVTVTASSAIYDSPNAGTTVPMPVVPALVTPDISSADLASTADRAYLQVVGAPNRRPALRVLDDDRRGADRRQIVQGLTDPRFDQVIVCVKDICTLAVPKLKKPLQTSALETPR